MILKIDTKLGSEVKFLSTEDGKFNSCTLTQLNRTQTYISDLYFSDRILLNYEYSKGSLTFVNAIIENMLWDAVHE